MRKKLIIFCCAVIMLFCPYALEASAISEIQKKAIVENCSLIKESLIITQRADVKLRYDFGRSFEAILLRYITPLNVKLLENNMSSTVLIDNQSDFASAKKDFSDNFVRYQQSLEELINIDCRIEPDEFYAKLKIVRERRKLVAKLVAKLKQLTLDNEKLVTDLKGKL